MTTKVQLFTEVTEWKLKKLVVRSRQTKFAC